MNKRVAHWACGPAFQARTVAQAMALPVVLYTSADLHQLAREDRALAAKLRAKRPRGWKRRAAALESRAARRAAKAVDALATEMAASLAMLPSKRSGGGRGR